MKRQLTFFNRDGPAGKKRKGKITELVTKMYGWMERWRKEEVKKDHQPTHTHSTHTHAPYIPSPPPPGG